MCIRPYQPPYWPNLAPNDIWLFNGKKKKNKNKTLLSGDENLRPRMIFKKNNAQISKATHKDKIANSYQSGGYHFG